MVITAEREANLTYPILTTLVGLLSFTACGIILGFITQVANEGLIILCGAPAGSMLMLVLLRRLKKSRILPALIMSTFGGFSGMVVGLMTGAFVFWFTARVFPSLSDSQLMTQTIPNVCLFITANTVFGAYMASFLYGRGAISFFARVSGAASIPYGLVMGMPDDTNLFGFDRYSLLLLISFGAATGLSVGLYGVIKAKSCQLMAQRKKRSAAKT